jgi:hypothetical protein
MMKKTRKKNRKSSFQSYYRGDLNPKRKQETLNSGPQFSSLDFRFGSASSCHAKNFFFEESD